MSVGKVENVEVIADAGAVTTKPSESVWFLNVLTTERRGCNSRSGIIVSEDFETILDASNSDMREQWQQVSWFASRIFANQARWMGTSRTTQLRVRTNSSQPKNLYAYLKYLNESARHLLSAE